MWLRVTFLWGHHKWLRKRIMALLTRAAFKTKFQNDKLVSHHALRESVLIFGALGPREEGVILKKLRRDCAEWTMYYRGGSTPHPDESMN